MPTKRLPLIADVAQRYSDISLDAHGLNMMVEKDANGELWSYKRPGLQTFYTNPATGTFVTAFVGPTDAVWMGYATTSLGFTLKPVTGVFVGTPLSVTNFSSWVGEDSAAVASGGSTASYLVYQNTSGTYSAYKFNQNGFTAGTAPSDPNMDTLVSGVVQLDGTFYVMDTNGGIWNSNVNDPNSGWGGGNVRYANQTPGIGIALRKQLAYIVALKSRDVEFFYDAGNPSGSPLSPVLAQRLQFGCASAATIAEYNSTLFWVAQGNKGQQFVVNMDKLDAKTISTPAIDRLINASALWKGFMASALGHTYYCLAQPITSGLSFIGTQVLAYDVDNHTWVKWTFNGLQLQAAAEALNPYFQTLVFDSAGNGYTFSDNAPDVEGVVDWELVTPPFDAGSRKFKVITRMDFLSDNVSSTPLQVRWSDDDQKTWTSWREVDLTVARPTLTECGAFHRRTFHFRHNGPQSFRLQAVDVEYLEGTL